MAGMAPVRVVPQLLEPPPARPDRPRFPAARVRLGPVDIQISSPCNMIMNQATKANGS